MSNQQLPVLEFIERERQKGTNDQEIQHKLLDAGWQMDIIQQALASASITFKDPTKDSVNGIMVPPKTQFEILLEYAKNPWVIAGLCFFILVLLALFI